MLLTDPVLQKLNGRLVAEWRVVPFPAEPLRSMLLHLTSDLSRRNSRLTWDEKRRDNWSEGVEFPILVHHDQRLDAARKARSQLVFRIIIQGHLSPDVIGTTTASNQKNKMLPATSLSRTGAVPSTQFAGFALGEEPVELVVRSLDIGESAVQRAAECLSPDERARADRFAFQRDRKRFVAARAGLRGLLVSRLGCLPEVVEIVTGIHGKPALSGRHGSGRLVRNPYPYVCPANSPGFQRS